ncbi:MAG: hypothetical protein A3E78_03240 [Alphaproteobacteria bacterium RIFCSPHIGHO2_12_FULL_63_12]|nr:MAG: hypothetical protein A3E78_03240 [Alphaproteobacteria bacterium RIFCSPHIGHO2_12_FULL_63_12]
MMTFTEDGHFVPHERFMPLCWKQYAIGAEYPMIPVEPRNMKSHNHFFACIHTAWENLPEALQKKYPTEEALRAKALVETNWCTERDHVCDTPGKAKYLAGIIRHYSEYSVIKVSGNVVKVFEPKSQAVALMPAEDFKQSKEDVLDWIEALNPGLKIREIKKEASRVAPPEKQRAIAAPITMASPAMGDQPTSAPAYFAYARTWIMASQVRDAAFARWEAERSLRDDLRVSIPNRRQLEDLLGRQFTEEGVAL